MLQTMQVKSVIFKAYFIRDLFPTDLYQFVQKVLSILDRKELWQLKDLST